MKPVGCHDPPPYSIRIRSQTKKKKKRKEKREIPRRYPTIYHKSRHFTRLYAKDGGAPVFRLDRASTYKLLIYTTAIMPLRLRLSPASFLPAVAAIRSLAKRRFARGNLPPLFCLVAATRFKRYILGLEIARNTSLASKLTSAFRRYLLGKMNRPDIFISNAYSRFEVSIPGLEDLRSFRVRDEFGSLVIFLSLTVEFERSFVSHCWSVSLSLHEFVVL